MPREIAKMKWKSLKILLALVMNLKLSKRAMLHIDTHAETTEIREEAGVDFRAQVYIFGSKQARLCTTLSRRSLFATKKKCLSHS